MKMGPCGPAGRISCTARCGTCVAAVSLTFEAMAERRGRIKRQASRARVHPRSAYGG